MAQKKLEENIEPDTETNILDLFAGIGGLSFGISNQSDKYNIVGAVDSDEYAVKTFNENHTKNIAVQEDLSQLEPNKYSQNFDVSVADVDVICGGPPCKGFSSVRPDRSDNSRDDRNYLYQFFFDYIEYFRPDVFVMENVPEVQTHKNDKGNRIFDSILRRCCEIGYKFEWKLLNSAHYGVPQSRTRLVLVGSVSEDCDIRFPRPDFQIQEGVDVKSKSKLFEADCEKKAVKVESVFKDLPVLEDNESNSDYLFEPSKIENQKQREYIEYLRQDDPELTNHVTSDNGELMKKRMSFAGEQKEEIPSYISPSSGYSSTYSRLYKDEPSTTLTTNFTTPSSTRCIHPYEPRAISVREGARIQSFPDKFTFCGPRTSVTSQIGNAVPPKLGEAIGRTLSYCINQFNEESE